MRLSRPQHWGVRGPVSLLLFPVSLIFRSVVWLRKQCYRIGLFSRWSSPVPVIVVGNITVGGAGKTPLVIALTELLVAEGQRVGIITRGYGGSASNGITVVHPDSDPAVVGDEAVLLSARTGVSVVAGAERVEVVKKILSLGPLDFVISDDGLQHYALERQMEIAVVDSSYRFGNGFCLPAGPLREPLSRLNSVDMVAYSSGVSGGVNGNNRTDMGYELVGTTLVNVNDSAHLRALADLEGSVVHAVAGIASPARFFNSLREHGLQVIEHPFGDHARFSKADVEFDDQYPVLMTEKDKVKCSHMNLKDTWYLPVRAVLDEELVTAFLNRALS